MAPPVTQAPLLDLNMLILVQMQVARLGAGLAWKSIGWVAALVVLARLPDLKAKTTQAKGALMLAC